ncbi:hypothetical protein [Nocardia pseudobrasiliensis]|uniref:Uncharacterized protein n=1 Tax=Nocardia pseudobrasiliensis TaxID=45979 RepID=A0A370HY94_9NOCA|nr:hypothetical protein [Nocardia pseudobrasiliensis]RDI63477.1 hypothetical protein DFR76_110174 [Nocardia pseudobrasiliensis]
MTDGGGPFRTFCHINEYGLEGFEKLHQMVATSAPLVLWGPSSMLIDSPHCRLTRNEFLELVERGTVRILGRRKWLEGPAGRLGSGWEYAGWTPGIDDVIAGFAREDESEDDDRRRVSYADDEGGDRWAPEYLERRPELFERIYRPLTSEDAISHFPAGVVEKAKAAENPRAFVLKVIRDSYNHDAALADSRTRTPFLLTPRESGFSQLLEDVRRDSPVRFPDFPQTPLLTQFQLAELTSEVLRILQFLEFGRWRRGLTKFMFSREQATLATWMAQICGQLERDRRRFGPSDPSETAASLTGELILRMHEEFDAERQSREQYVRRRRALLSIDPNKVGAAIVEGGSTAVGFATGSAFGGGVTGAVLGAVGIAPAAMRLGQSLAGRLGLHPTEYGSNCHWAFMYAFGRTGATAAQRARLQRTLDLLVQG